MSQISATNQYSQNPTLTRRRNYRLLAISAVVLLAVGALVFLSMRDTKVYYVTVGELMGQGSSAYGQQVRVSGKVLPGSIRHLPDGTVRFTATDSTGKLKVEYNGVVPDVFGPKAQVVVEGKEGSNGVFQANTLLAKCPSKFQAANQ